MTDDDVRRATVDLAMHGGYLVETTGARSRVVPIETAGNVVPLTRPVPGCRHLRQVVLPRGRLSRRWWRS